MTVGVLALQGDFSEHAELLRLLKVRWREVRTLEDLRCVHRLIIPGGESTVIAQLLSTTGLREEIQRRAAQGTLPIYGTCAGAILLANRVSGKEPPRSLGLLDVTVDRNAYGTQTQSFEAILKVKGLRSPVRAAFIRAPQITAVGEGVEVLASHGGKPVLVRQGDILAGTFHPEVRGRTEIHELFMKF